MLPQDIFYRWDDLPTKKARCYGRKDIAELALHFWSKRTPHKDGWRLMKVWDKWVIYPINMR